jgi:hypothetical protein
LTLHGFRSVWIPAGFGKPQENKMTKSSHIQLFSSTQKRAENLPIYRAGESGPCWRIQSGLVRLAHSHLDESGSFAGIAYAGDLLGSEVLIHGTYLYDAWPLGDVKLEPCPELRPDMLLLNLLSAHRRAEELLALRIGEAEQRIRLLLQFLSSKSHTEDNMMFMPSLRDMAEMTALNHETVCRIISRLRRLGQLQRFGRHNGVMELVIKQPHPLHAA